MTNIRRDRHERERVRATKPRALVPPQLHCIRSILLFAARTPHDTDRHARPIGTLSAGRPHATCFGDVDTLSNVRASAGWRGGLRTKASRLSVEIARAGGDACGSEQRVLSAREP